MNIEKLMHARKLVDFIEGEINLKLIPSNFCPYNNHIPALFTDVILQAGLNYKHIVYPRVLSVYKNYPKTDSVKKFCALIEKVGLEKIIHWKNEVKLNRLKNLLSFCLINNIDTAEELKLFLVKAENKGKFLAIDGIGLKTYDYLLKLMNVDTIAVDRHIFSFLEKAGIKTNDYNYSKNVVEFAADMMNISRRSIDYSIWTYMAYELKNTKIQTSLNF